MPANLLTITPQLHDYQPIIAAPPNEPTTWHCRRCGNFKPDQLKPAAGSTTPCQPNS